jgi:ferredoxin
VPPAPKKCYSLHQNDLNPERDERIDAMTTTINSECIMCGACESECPEGAISAGDDRYIIDPEKCRDCGACADVCPTGACVPA